MARVTLNIAKAYDDGFIENIEKTKYFQLHKNAASRTDLYCFAIALCEMEGKEPTPISAVGASKSTLIAGDFLQAVYSIRQDVTYKILDQAVIQDPTDGSILYNLAQDDMVALRVVMRLGWEIPNPVNALNETDARFPFASLKPASTPSL